MAGDQFRSIVDSLPGLVALFAADGSVEFVNRKMLEYYGATLDEMRDWVSREHVHPDDLPGVIAKWSTCLRTGQTYETEARLRRADGVYRWFQIRAAPLLDAQENILLWHLLQTDVDDQKRVEALLAGEKHVLEMVAQGHPLPAVLDGLCRLVEEVAVDCHCGILFPDAQGKTWQYAAGPTLPFGYNKAMEGRPAHAEAGPCGMAAHLKIQVIVQDVVQDRRWDMYGWGNLALQHGLRSCWSSPILSRDRQAFGALALYRREPGTPSDFQRELLRQLTHIASIAIERTRTEEALRHSQQMLTEAQHLSSTGSFLWRLASDEITWSRETYRIFEVDPAVAVTLDLIGSRVHAEDLPLFHEMIERAREGADLDYEIRLRIPGNTIKYLHLAAHGSRDKAGQLEYIGAIQDETRRRGSEEALSKVRSELTHVSRVTSLGALTASITHEVNQPLSGIITNANTCLRMLASDPPNVDGARETARRTIRDGNRASDVISRLRAMFAKKGTTIEAVDLNEATREVIALSLSELQRSRVVLQTQLDDDLMPVTGDRVQLQQVILNLLMNATDAMREIEDRPRQLVISTAEDDNDHVRLSMRDSGVGIEAHDAERIFDAFYTTKSTGMGMGLSVSRSIIERHHGRLWAESNDGPGARFSFSIPRTGATAANEIHGTRDARHAPPRASASAEISMGAR